MMTKRMLVAAVATGGAVWLAMAGASSAQASGTVSPSADSASRWLATQTVDGVYLYGGFPDWGATADVAIAHAAAGHASTVGAPTLAALKANAAAASGLNSSVPSAPGTAKVALVAAIYGEDATNFGGVDLVAALNGLLVTSGPFAGLYNDGADPNPSFPNTFTQSYAVTAASRLGVGSAQSVSFLLAQQCADGGFRLEAQGATCESDVDSTALVLQALEAARVAGVGDSAAMQSALSAGGNYLVMNQQVDGSFSSSGVWGMVNTNTTGVAAQALYSTGSTAPARLATKWLVSQQLGCDVVESARGAFAYDSTGRDAAIAAATIPAGQEDGYRRATAQVILGLGGASLATLTDADLPVEGSAPSCGENPTTTTTTTPASTSTTAPTSTSTTAPDTTSSTVATTSTTAPTSSTAPSTSTTAFGTFSGSNSNGSDVAVAGAVQTADSSGRSSRLASTGTSATTVVVLAAALIALGAGAAATSTRLRRRVR